MKTIESTLEMTTPSPPTLEDPDSVKNGSHESSECAQIKDKETEEVVKNGHNNESNGISSPKPDENGEKPEKLEENGVNQVKDDENIDKSEPMNTEDAKPDETEDKPNENGEKSNETIENEGKTTEKEAENKEETEPKKVVELVLANATDSDSEEEQASKKEDEEQTKIDYNNALEDLTKIANNSKKINEDQDVKPGVKRQPSESGEEADAKKMKLDLEEKKVDPVKKHLQNLTREQLEDIVTQKLAEVISARSEIGELRRKCDLYEQENEKWKKKQQLLQKMCMDLNTVMKRYIVDKQNEKEKSTPIKITRSVGLQVVTDRNRRSQNAVAAKTTTTPNPVTPVAVPATISNQVVIQKTTVAQNLNIVKKVMPATTITTNGLKTTHSIVVKKPLVPSQTSVASSAARLQTLPSSVSIIQTPTANNTQNQPKKVIDVISLSDEEEDSGQNKPTAIAKPLIRPNSTTITPARRLNHPAPLPDPPRHQLVSSSPGMKNPPPRPTLKISRLQNGIVLSWSMNIVAGSHALIQSYQIYAYQETASQKPDASLWKKVGDVKALPLPMACTLTQFLKGNKYHFAVRAKDMHNRVGSFSEPQSIALT